MSVEFPRNSLKACLKRYSSKRFLLIKRSSSNKGILIKKEVTFFISRSKAKTVNTITQC